MVISALLAKIVLYTTASSFFVGALGSIWYGESFLWLKIMLSIVTAILPLDILATDVIVCYPYSKGTTTTSISSTLAVTSGHLLFKDMLRMIVYLHRIIVNFVIYLASFTYNIAFFILILTILTLLNFKMV